MVLSTLASHTKVSQVEDVGGAAACSLVLSGLSLRGRAGLVRDGRVDLIEVAFLRVGGHVACVVVEREMG